ncbi:MAG: Bug family tripartite tricarboxylate transporter substrate binding protein [Cellvibrionaceae bacterium]
MKLSKLVLSVVVGSTVALTSGLIHAADFSGKTIEWIIPFKEGGGSDKWSRFYAPLLSEALPGKPTVVVKNVPGAGSTKGANQFASRAKPDGLTILGTSGSTQFPYLLNDKRVKYEYKDWNIVLASPTGGVVYVSPKTGIKSAAELKTTTVPLVYGSQGATSLDLVPLLAFEMLGAPVEAIFGMKGRSAGRLAFERGEVNIDYQTSGAYISKVKPLVAFDKAVPIMSWGALNAKGEIVRDPSFPNLPSFPEVYEQAHGKKPSGPAWEAWKAFFAAGFPSQKMVFLPKGTSQDIVDAYVAAFEKVISAPDFVSKSAKRLGLYQQVTGSNAGAKLTTAINVSDDAKAWVKDWLNKKYSVSLD